MSGRPFAGDLADLPEHAFGARSLTWWGVIGFIAIEAAGFALAAGAYFFLMNQEQNWPPGKIPPPDLLASSIFTVALLLSEVPNVWAKRVGEREDLGATRLALVAMSLVGIVLIVIRAFELASLDVSWTENAYGSIVWAILILHTTHLLTDWGDTLVLTALMFTRHARPRRFGDVSENSVYWHFVVAAWLPIYLLLYWVPRWMGGTP